MENKIVDIYLGMHGGTNRFVHELIADDYKTFIIEDVLHPTVDNFLQKCRDMKIKKGNVSYNIDKVSFIEKIQKKGTKVIVGDFGEDTTINLNILDNAARIYSIVPNLSSIEDIKEFYKRQSEMESIRNRNYIHNIEKSEGPVGIRVGGSHGIIIKELKKTGSYDVNIISERIVASYHSMVVRKLCLGIVVDDNEYRKGAILWTLSGLKDIARNIHGKEDFALNSKYYSLYFAFLNAMVDSYSGEIENIKKNNLADLFTTQGLSNPFNKRIPRQEIREFLKQFSFQKYGTTVYYDRLEKQGIIF